LLLIFASLIFFVIFSLSTSSIQSLIKYDIDSLFLKGAPYKTTFFCASRNGNEDDWIGVKDDDVNDDEGDGDGDLVNEVDLCINVFFGRGIFIGKVCIKVLYIPTL
jgi:hypothetical protein